MEGEATLPEGVCRLHSRKLPSFLVYVMRAASMLKPDSATAKDLYRPRRPRSLNGVAPPGGERA